MRDQNYRPNSNLCFYLNYVIIGGKKKKRISLNRELHNNYEHILTNVPNNSYILENTFVYIKST